MLRIGTGFRDAYFESGVGTTLLVVVLHGCVAARGATSLAPDALHESNRCHKRPLELMQ